MENRSYEEHALGMTYQMTIDAFLDHSQDNQPQENKTYQDALRCLEDAKQYRSWEKKRKIAQKAIALCEECTEAYLLWGRYCENEMESMHIYKTGMEKTMFALGNDYFRKQRKDCYEDEKARALLHILYAYGGILYEAGYMKKAKEQFERLLSLHPNDHLQCRYYLWCIYLYFEDLEKCQDLLQRYEDKEDTFYAYIQVLYYYKRQELEKVKAAIPILKAKNDSLFALCTYQRVPRVLRNETFEPGSLQEAMHCFAILRKVTTTLEFLAKHLV